MLSPSHAYPERLCTNCGSVSIFEIQVQLKYTLAKFIGRFGKSIPGGSPDVRD